MTGNDKKEAAQKLPTSLFSCDFPFERWQRKLNAEGAADCWMAPYYMEYAHATIFDPSNSFYQDFHST